jgi:hypothetical protein
VFPPVSTAIRGVCVCVCAREQGVGAGPAAPQPLNFSDPTKTTKAQLPYPTSRPPTKQRAPTDWDKLEQELKAEEKDEKLEGAPRPAPPCPSRVVGLVVCARCPRVVVPGAHHVERCGLCDAEHDAASAVRWVAWALEVWRAVHACD